MLSLGADFAASFYGAKRLGLRGGDDWCGWRAGRPFGPVGIIVGLFVEPSPRIRRWSRMEGIRPSGGWCHPWPARAVGKLSCGVGMILLFAADVLWRAVRG
jgi:hypothetical protein